jgi:DNA invertase Pin-like site-specific DNA recombinase
MAEVAIYARVSTDDKGQDVENQLMQLRKYCEAKNYNVYKEYSEEVTGTGKKRRPAFEEMIEDARKRKFDVLLVWSYDRFSRAGLKDIHFISDLNQWGVKFVSFQESFLDMTTETGELLLPIFAWIAKQEAKKISERTKAGLQRAVREGKSLGRPKSELGMEKMLALKQQGKSLSEIAKELGTSKETVRRRLTQGIQKLEEEKKPDQLL